MANKLNGAEAFIIGEALKHYGKFMKKEILKLEKKGVRSVYHHSFFEQMGESIMVTLPKVTYKEKPLRKY